MIEIAKRAVACKGWRWMEGMAVFNPDMPDIWYPRIGGERAPQHPFLLPDFDDPATLGCLLHLVREACEPNRAPGDWPMVCTYQSQAKKWGVGAWLNESGKATFAALVLPTFDTEGEALVAALEVAECGVMS